MAEIHVQAAGAPSTLHKDNLHWAQYWLPFTKSLGLPQWRTDEDPSRMHIEADYFLLFSMHVLRCIRPRSPGYYMNGKAKQAKPDSVTAPIAAVKRLHKRKGLHKSIPATAQIRIALDGVANAYQERYGIESLLVHRKEPMPFAVTDACIMLPPGTKLGSRMVDKNTLYWRSLQAALNTAKVTGYRKDELATAKTGSRLLSRAHVVFFIHGREVTDPTHADIQSLDTTCFVGIRPPTSKADRTGKLYGNFFAYIRWQCAETNLAYSLAQLELYFPCKGELREMTPLFCVAPNRAFTHSQLDLALQHLLKAVTNRHPRLLLAEHHKRYSWHSFRIALCSALKRCDVPDPTIQHLCRWATPESIKIYGRLDMVQYSGFIDAALTQSYNGVQAASLIRPHIDEDDIIAQLAGIVQHLNAENKTV